MVTPSAERSARYRAKDVEAYRARKNAYAKTPEQKAKRREYQAKWYAANREKANRQANESHARVRKARSPEQRHDAHLRATYGINRDDYLRMLDEQGGKCLICDSPEPRGPKSWHVDHCHKTGKIRGLLCNMCNPRLGWHETYLEKIVAYLKR